MNPLLITPGVFLAPAAAPLLCAQDAPSPAAPPAAPPDPRAIAIVVRTSEDLAATKQFSASGNTELVTRIAEIHAVAQLQALSKSDEYKKALEAAAKSPVNLAKNLTTHPVETITGVPKGIFKFINRTGKAVKEASEDRPRSPYEDSSVEGAVGFSKAKHSLAAGPGVDPYSSNPVFLNALNGVAWASYGGKITLTAALAPVGGGAGTALTNVQVSDTALNAIRDSSPMTCGGPTRKSLARCLSAFSLAVATTPRLLIKDLNGGSVSQPPWCCRNSFTRCHKDSAFYRTSAHPSNAN